MSNFGPRLASVMKKRGISPKKLAQLACMTKHQVELYLNRSVPMYRTVLRIAKALGEDVSLFAGVITYDNFVIPGRTGSIAVPSDEERDDDEEWADDEEPIVAPPSSPWAEQAAQWELSIRADERKKVLDALAAFLAKETT